VSIIFDRAEGLIADSSDNVDGVLDTVEAALTHPARTRSRGMTYSPRAVS